MRTTSLGIVALLLLFALPVGAATADQASSTGQLETDLVPPYLSIMVTCTDPTAPTGFVNYEVDIINGGIDEPMTWTEPGQGRGRLVNAWRLRLGNGDVIVTTQPCSYTTFNG